MVRFIIKFTIFIFYYNFSQNVIGYYPYRSQLVTVWDVARVGKIVLYIYIYIYNSICGEYGFEYSTSLLKTPK